MRNILAHMPHKEKNTFAQQLKAVWLAPTREQAYRRAEDLCQQYEQRFPKVIGCEAEVRRNFWKWTPWSPWEKSASGNWKWVSR